MVNSGRPLIPIFVWIVLLLICFPVQHTQAALSTSTANMTLTVGTSQTFTISGGTGFYKVTSSDSAVATASISGSAGDQGSVQAIALGTATITIEDSTGDTTTIAVSVSEITLDKNSVSLVPQGTANVTILTGSTYYNVVSSDNAVATANIYDDTVTITGVATGTAVVTVSDSNSNTATISVNVGASFSVSPSSMILSIGETDTAVISDSSGFYNATSSDTSIATVVLSGTTVTITGVQAGSVVITIQNSAGFTTTVDVTVDLSVFSKLALGLSESTTVDLTNGSGFYNVTIADKTIASVTLASSDATITGLAAGKTNITIEDNQSNKFEYEVTVQLPPPVLEWSVAGTLVEISWDKVEGAGSYTLFFAPPDANGEPAVANIDYINVGALGGLLVNLSSGDHFFAVLQAVHPTYSDVSSTASNVIEVIVP